MNQILFTITFSPTQILKSITSFHWRIVSSIWISLSNIQASDIGSDTDMIFLLSYPYPHLTFEYGYRYKYWRMWKNDTRIRVGGWFGYKYMWIIHIQWHPSLVWFRSLLSGHRAPLQPLSGEIFWSRVSVFQVCFLCTWANRSRDGAINTLSVPARHCTYYCLTKLTP